MTFQNVLLRSVSGVALACEVVDGELRINISWPGVPPIIVPPGENVTIRAEGNEVIMARGECE